MLDVKIRTTWEKIKRAFGRGEVSLRIRTLLMKDGETICTPNGTKVSYLGGGWYHIGGYSWDGSDTEQTLEAIYG